MKNRICRRDQARANRAEGSDGGMAGHRHGGSRSNGIGGLLHARVLALVIVSTGLLNFACGAVPLAQNYSVIFRNADQEQYVEGCGLERLPDGTLVAVVPVVPRSQWSAARRVQQSRIHILTSADAGATWRPASQLNFYSAVPWLHDGKLYLFANKGGTKYRNKDLVLLRSDDGGKTWTDPVRLFEGHFWNCHTGIVVKDQKLYWAMGDLSFGMSRRGPRAIAGDLSQDPMNPAAWRISNPVPFPGIPASLGNPKFSDRGTWYLECNVIDVAGNLRILNTVKAFGQTTTNLSGVFDLKDDGTKLTLEFIQFNPMPGGHLKFCVVYDEPSKLFWATSNYAVDGQGYIGLWKNTEDEQGKKQFKTGGNDRRFLMLSYSVDGLNWFQAGCVARAPKLSQSFMYGKLMVDGDDLAIIARSNINGPNLHDADSATFHRVKNFRALALDLFPEETAKN